MTALMAFITIVTIAVDIAKKINRNIYYRNLDGIPVYKHFDSNYTGTNISSKCCWSTTCHISRNKQQRITHLHGVTVKAFPFNQDVTVV